MSSHPLLSRIMTSYVKLRTYVSTRSEIIKQEVKPIRNSSKLLPLNPILGKDLLLQVGGRLSNASLSPSQQHPVILSGHDILSQLLFKYYHVGQGHCGPTLLLSHTGNQLHVMGARPLAGSTCNSCIICKKISARTESQCTEQLPVA